MISLKQKFYTGLILFTLLPSRSFAEVKNPISYDNFPEFMAAILDIVVKIGAPIAILMVIYSGYLFVTAQGNDEKLTTAKKALLWALIGTMVLLGAEIISDVICNTIDDISPGNCNT